MKKIAIDITALSDQYKDRGIGTYTENIVDELVGLYLTTIYKLKNLS